ALESANTTVTNSEYVKLQVDDHSLYGRFIKRGIIDGIVSKITNQLLPNYNNSGESNQFNNIQSYIGINVRSYKRLVQLDTDFSVLVDQKPAADADNSVCSSIQKKKLSSAQLAGIVIGSVAFAVIAIVSVSYSATSVHSIEVDLVPYDEFPNDSYLLQTDTLCNRTYLLITKDVNDIESTPAFTSTMTKANNGSSIRVEVSFQVPEGSGSIIVKALDTENGIAKIISIPYVCKKLIPNIVEIGLINEPLSTSQPYQYEFKITNNEMISRPLPFIYTTNNTISWSLIELQQFGRNTFFMNFYPTTSNIIAGPPRVDVIYGTLYYPITRLIQFDIPSPEIEYEISNISFSMPQTPSSPLIGSFQLLKNDTRDLVFEIKVDGSRKRLATVPVSGTPYNSTYNFVISHRDSVFYQIDILACQLNRCVFTKFIPITPLYTVVPPPIQVIYTAFYAYVQSDLDGMYFAHLIADNKLYSKGDKVQEYIIEWQSSHIMLPLCRPFDLDDSIFGFKTGTYAEYSRSVVFPISKHEKRQLVPITFQEYSTGTVFVAPNPPQSVIDEKVPIISSFELIPIPGNNKYIILRVKIVDDLSGFSTLTVEGQNPLILTSANLVEGNLLGGTYEVLIENHNFLYTKFVISDFASNYDYYGIDVQLSITEVSKIVPISNPKNYLYHSLNFELTSASWSHNYVDVSNSSYTIDFRFSVTHPNTEYAPLLRLSQSKTLNYNLVYPTNTYEFLKEKKFYGKWNQVSSQYEIPVKIPLRMFSGRLFYEVVYLENIISSSYLTNSFPNSIVNVYSQIADMVGPIFETLTRFPIGGEATNPASGSGIIGWDYNVSDTLNGLDYGRITVVGDHDQFEYQFLITEPSGFFRINTFQNCRSQTYTITSIYLVDKGGYESNIDMALINFPEINHRRINVTCQPSSDTTPPVLDFLQCTQTAIDVGSNNRVLKCKAGASDIESGMHTKKHPLIYLSSIHQIIKFEPSSFDIQYDSGIPTIGKYDYEMTLPHGFGYPEYIAISIYGLMDNHANFNGYSAQDLKNLNNSTMFQYSIDTKAFSINTHPIIESTGGITFSGGELLIIGKSFGTDNSSVVKIQYVNGQGLSTTSIPTFYSSTALIIKDVRPLTNQSYFKIQIEKKSGNFLSNEFIVYPKNSLIYPQPNSSSQQSSSSSSSSEDIPPTQRPNPCINNCGGELQGYCSPTGCVCHSPWIGKDCKSKVIIIPTPSINNTLPSTNISIPSTSDKEATLFKGLISIIELQELNQNNVAIHKYPFTQWIWSNISTDNEPVKYLYSTNITNQLDQSTTTVNVSIQYFDKQQNITFAGELLNMNQYSIKYSINITSYTFTNSLNQLQLIMKVSLESQQDQGCSALESGNTTVTNSEYVKLQVDDHSLYGRFIKRGVIDGRISTITNQLLQNYNGESSQFNNIQNYIGINVRSYKTLVQLDPDFSVLVDQKPAADTDNSVCSSIRKKKLSSAQLAGIVIGSVAFAAIAIVSVSYCIYKKKKQEKFNKNVGNKLKIAAKG
ncbi:hypothetical protein CYY_009060, partial [Polysphondylium violaceum]